MTSKGNRRGTSILQQRVHTLVWCDIARFYINVIVFGVPKWSTAIQIVYIGEASFLHCVGREILYEMLVMRGWHHALQTSDEEQSILPWCNSP
jgi:hypothetical protein